MKLTFLGAAREVTGSSYLLEADGVRFLVDCGMFQGGREARDKNRRAFSFDPRTIDFVILTHAHIDHSGLLPRLVALGFKGRIHTTRATCDLLAVMLPDSAHIQEKEAEYQNLHRFRQGMARRDAARGSYPRDTAPLYTVAQAQASLKQLNPVDYDLEIAPHPQVRCTFRDAGHILGSAIVEVWVGEGPRRRKIVFSGDLGQPARPLLRDPTPIFDADYLLVESTYGNRDHKSMEATQDELVTAINDTIERKGGNVIIPAFAVGRTQDMLYLLADLTRQARIPKLSVFVDSPMATAATEITFKHMELLDAETHALMGRHGGAQYFRKLEFVEDVEESKALDRVTGGAVIISASGMCEAGRIKYHLRANLARRESTILITGFQAAGTFGRRLVDGAKRVRLLGEDIPVRADLYTLGGLSAHADRTALLAWLGHFRSKPRQVFVVHGEETVAKDFAADLKTQFDWDATAPAPGHGVILE
ncbi:MBL fold metallo-hydrolase [Thiobacillus sp.]|uniref:MBL fold metallo-hydrolase RNA specificity domain-containing protein n=1 Tax=Thiobacillus sp. TaxID=924 RepID=UPI0018377EEF|nr:MBL fold metallo-hydrolase [Thiobacillus sp.]MBC2729724.1 MBL fold metallo-hydrolase [Thiobacillus sp.]MBC2738459.1 MBL fold metallo-hydrolase [Thiobacillus sp.]MBC2761260.1 MBL fold metallo-hydrolase [Thiobacillus sp.]